MRVLVSTTPGWGHVSPVLPVAEELRRRGHHVVWATASDAARGLAGRGFDVEECGLALADRLPRAARLLAERAADVAPEQRRAHAFTTNFALLGALQTLDRMRELTSEFGPDVIVREPAELASAAIAHGADIHYVTVGFGGIVPAPARRMADEALASALTARGIAPRSDDWHFGDLYLHPMPASLDGDDVPATARRVRPSSTAVGSSASSDAGALGPLGLERPLVYATFGTEFGPLAPWRELLGALGGLDADALVTTGASGLPPDAPVPANVTVADYVDQQLVFERAAVVVSHGGSGTVLGAAAAGLPQVCIPLGADQFENAVAVATRGIGVMVAPPDRGAATIAGAVQRALTDAAIAAAARKVASELAAGADVQQAAGWIEGLGSTSP